MPNMEQLDVPLEHMYLKPKVIISDTGRKFLQVEENYS